MARPEKQPVLRKSQIPALGSGWFARITATLAAVGVGWLYVFDKSFASCPPGILDALIGIPAGILTGHVMWAWLRPECEKTLLEAGGSWLRLLIGPRGFSLGSAKHIPLFFVMFLGLAAVGTGLRTHLGLHWPWVNPG